MKILIVAQYFPPDITAAAFRMYDTARLLEDSGHEVHVITAYPHRSLANGSPTGQYDGRISGVWRTRVARLTRGGFVDYIRHYASFMVGSSWLGLRRWLARWKPDVIWASSPPLFVGLSGVALARLFAVPLVVDIRDIWPASAVGTGQISEQGRAYRFGIRMEQYVYDRASHITCVACPMRDYIQTKTKTPVTVVYNGARASDVSAGDLNVGSEDERTLLYAGNLGRAQQLDLLIRAWANVSERNGACQWTVKLVGSGVLEKDLQQLAADLGVSKSVVFSPPVSREEAMRQMSRAAVLCVSLQADKAFERTIPSKIFDCMAAGKPILAGVSGEGRAILGSTGANLCYEPGNLKSLEKALERLMREYRHVRQFAYKNAQVIRRSYTRERAVAALEGVFNSVVSNGRSSPIPQQYQVDIEGDRESHGTGGDASSEGRIAEVPISQANDRAAQKKSASGAT